MAFPIVAALGLASGLFGAAGAREQNKAVAAANEPKPYEEHRTTAPWAPTIPALEGLLPLAREIFDARRKYPAPPTYRGGGGAARGRMAELANAATDRALSSTFIPETQNSLLSMLRGPNPLLQAAFDRAQSYDPIRPGLFTFGGLAPTPALDRFLGGLMSGQTRLGEQRPMIPPTPLVAQIAGRHFEGLDLPHLTHRQE